MKAAILGLMLVAGGASATPYIVIPADIGVIFHEDCFCSKETKRKKNASINIGIRIGFDGTSRIVGGVRNVP